MNLIWNNISVFIPGLGNEEPTIGLAPLVAELSKGAAHTQGQNNGISEVRRKASDANKESILSNKQSMKSLSVSFFAKQNNGLIKTTIYQTSRVTSSSPPETSWLCVCECAIVGPSPHTHFLLIFR
uniref:(northern house mosquito) hypothetical protein n=1 Tax=Culex pipiens TaxID=7175 RepID=A0A8D8GFZ6_CULPI